MARTPFKLRSQGSSFKMVGSSSPLPKAEVEITLPSGKKIINTGTKSVQDAQKIAADNAKIIANQKKKYMLDNPDYKMDDFGEPIGFKADLSNQPTVHLTGSDAKEFYSGADPNSNVVSKASDIYKTENLTEEFETEEGDVTYDKYTPGSLIGQSGGTVTTDLQASNFPPGTHMLETKSGVPYPKHDTWSASELTQYQKLSKEDQQAMVLRKQNQQTTE